MACPNQMHRLREPSIPHNRANSGQFACLQERSANGRLRGGAGRIRTSNQTVIARFKNVPKQPVPIKT
jgi:hypothetical protein